MNRLNLFVTCFGLFCSVMILAGESRYELTIDATSQPSPPPRGRGPFPGSIFRATPWVSRFVST
jgi:hypothetical protein